MHGIDNLGIMVNQVYLLKLKKEAVLILLNYNRRIGPRRSGKGLSNVSVIDVRLLNNLSVYDIIQSISVIIASLGTFITVIISILKWRSERVDTKKQELNQEILALFYEARDAISYIRNPFGFVGEGSTRKSDPEKESPEEKQIYDKAYVVFERYNKKQDLFNKLYSMRYKYMALFGKESGKPFNDLNKIINDIFISARMLPYYWKDQGHRQWKNDDEFHKHLEDMHKHEAIFWQMTPDRDSITPRVDAVISEIETYSTKNKGKSK